MIFSNLVGVTTITITIAPLSFNDETRPAFVIDVFARETRAEARHYEGHEQRRHSEFKRM